MVIYVITREDIHRSGVARIESDHWEVGVRGFGRQFSKSLLVLIDGRSVGEIHHRVVQEALVVNDSFGHLIQDNRQFVFSGPGGRGSGEPGRIRGRVFLRRGIRGSGK